MGSNHSAPYEIGFPPRKKRKMQNSDSNHFDKNYLIESAEFWAERRYREDCYFQTNNRRGRENYAEIYSKTPAEYGNRSVSCWTFSACSGSGSSASASSSASGGGSQFVMKENVFPPPLPPSLPPASNKSAQSPLPSHHQFNRPPPGIQAKYLPSFG